MKNWIAIPLAVLLFSCSSSSTKIDEVQVATVGEIVHTVNENYPEGPYPKGEYSVRATLLQMEEDDQRCPRGFFLSDGDDAILLRTETGELNDSLLFLKELIGQAIQAVVRYNEQQPLCDALICDCLPFINVISVDASLKRDL